MRLDVRRRWHFLGRKPLGPGEGRGRLDGQGELCHFLRFGHFPRRGFNRLVGAVVVFRFGRRLFILDRRLLEHRFDFNRRRRGRPVHRLQGPERPQAETGDVQAEGQHDGGGQGGPPGFAACLYHVVIHG